jgi:hypothetical protein
MSTYPTRSTARSPLGTLVARPATPLGEADDIARARWMEENPPESGSFGDSYVQNVAAGPVFTLWRKAQALGFARDPDFRLTQQVLDDYTRPEYGVDQDLWDRYGEAVSDAHAEYIHETNMLIMEKRKALSKGGFGSFAGGILGSLSDPGSVAVGLLTGGAGFAARLGVAGNAAIAGGSNMLLTGIQASEDPGVTGMDVLRAGVGGAGFGAASAAGIQRLGTRVLAGAAGQALPPLAVDFLMDDRPGNQVLLDLGTNLAFGGLFNAIPPTNATPAQVRMAEKVNAVGTRMKGTALGTTPEYASDAVLDVLGIRDPTPAPDLSAYAPTDPSDSLVTGGNASESPSVRVTETAPPPSAMGAATAADTAKATLDAPADPFDFDVSEIARTAYATPKASYSKKFMIGGVDVGVFRWDMAGMVGGSEIPEFRAAGRILGTDWVPDETGAPITYSAYEYVQDRYKASLAETSLPADQAYLAHREAATKAGTPVLSKDEFAVQVGKAARRGETSADPNVAATVSVYRKAFEALKERARRHGIDLGWVENYLPRRYNAAAIDERIMDLGRRFAPSRDEQTQFAKGREILTGVLERSLAAKNAPKLKQTTFRGKKVMVPSTDRPEVLRARAEAILDRGGRSTTEDITAGRIVLDETYREQIPLPDGSTYDIGVEDLIENDIRVLFASYSQQLHGKMAIAKIGQVFGQEIDGLLEASESVGQIVKVLEQKARESGRPEKSWRPDLTKIETMLKQTAGMPLYESTGTSRTLDGIRKLNNIRSMANVGSSINNSVELVQAAAEIGGTFVAKRVVPGIEEVLTMARGGESSSQLAKDLFRMGIAIDRVASRILPRLGDDLANPIGKTAPEIGLAHGERMAFDWSIQSFSTDAARFTTAAAYLDKWADIAHAGNGFSEKRLALQGLSKRDESAILDQIRQHAVWTDKPGGTLDHMGFENWDPHTRRIFQQATSRTARRLVQENSPTSYAQWMTGPVGKMLSQYRNFAFTAHTAKFLAEVKTRDATTGYIIAATSVGAMALYTARTLLDASVRKDKREFLEDRLSLKKVVFAGYSRAGWSALFPTAIDTLVSDLGPYQPIFSYARTTGLRGGGLIGNPTVDFLKETGFNPLDFDPLKVPRAIAAPLIPGYQFSQQDWRAMKAGLAIPDILNLRKLADEYAKELPATSDE